MARWRVDMLGGLRLTDDAGPQTKFYSQKAAQLLARLAYPPLRSHGREEVIELLWPDGDFAASRANLRNLLAHLRRQLEPSPKEAGQVLRADRTHLCLEPAAIVSDVARFEAAAQAAERAGGDGEREEWLRQALALYGGELLPGWYADWVLLERERLQSRYVGVLRALRDLAERQRDEETSRDLTFRLARVSETPPPPRSLPPVVTPFLPTPHTRCFGREAQVRDVLVLLNDGHFVTLTGMGGVGKTRLAQEVAREWVQTGQGGAAWVPLDVVSSADLILPRILATLGASPRPHIPLLDQVRQSVQSNQITLLVLDNWEHLLALPASDRILADLNARLAPCHLLVTSRTATRTAGEWAYPVPPLPTPRATDSMSALRQAPSVRLFVNRAQLARRDFTLTPQNAGAVAELCAALEGIPLAIEIAGARSLVATPQEMCAEMQKRLRFLTARAQDGESASTRRHRSMRSTLEWSFALLSPALARFFATLAVFAGDFTVESARAVCRAEDALDHLEDLCRASLLVPSERGTQMRFRLLETVRAFAGEKLATSDEADARGRHADCFFDLARQAEAELTGRNQARWLTTLEDEHDNLRAALTWLSRQSDSMPGLRMGNALWRFWQTRGHLETGIAHLRALLDSGGDAREGWAVGATVDTADAIDAGAALAVARGEARNALGSLLIHANRFDEAEQEFRAALGLLVGHEAMRIGPLNNLGLIQLYRGEYTQAVEAFTDCLQIMGGNTTRFRCSFLNNRGSAYMNMEAYRLAETDLTEALRLYSEAENQRGIAKALSNLGIVALGLKQFDIAEDQIHQSLRLHHDLGDLEGCALCLEGLSQCCVEVGAWRRGATVLAAAEALRRDIAAPLRPVDEAGYRRTRDELRAVVGSDAFDLLLAEQETGFMDTLQAETARKPSERQPARA